MRKKYHNSYNHKTSYGKSSVQKNPVWEKLVAKKVEYGKVTPPQK